jgi:hypothetical protein
MNIRREILMPPLYRADFPECTFGLPWICANPDLVFLSHGLSTIRIATMKSGHSVCLL